MVEESGKQLKKSLNQWLASPEFSEINNYLRTVLSPSEVIRFLIRTDDTNVLKLPWEEWQFFVDYPKAEVGYGGTKFSKPQQVVTKKKPAKVRILAILGHSEGINLEADERLLRSLPGADEPVFLVQPKRKDINDSLWEQPWDIIFFAGHSITENDEGKIYLNDEESLTIDELWHALRKAVNNGLKLAIFNSCDGLGLAKRLDDINIPQMIVMRELVPDKVAQQFLKYFLSAFSGGKPFYLAAREAREQLHWLEEEFPCATWLPVIFQNVGEAALTWEELKGAKKPKSALQDLSWRRGLQMVLLTSLVVTSCVVGLRSQSVFKPLELKAFDHLMQQRKDQGSDPRILVVEITDADQRLPEQKGKKQGSSISDFALEKLLDKLESYQPRVIGLTLFRDPPDYAPELPELKERFQKSKVLYGICNVDELGDGERGFLPPPTLPEKRLGFTNGIGDDDNVIRRSILFMDTPATSVCPTSFSITLKLVEAYLEQESIPHPVIKLPKHSNDSLYIGNVLIPNLRYNPGIYGNSDDDNWGYKSIINYRSYRSVLEIADKVSLEDILRDKVISSKIKNKIILIGSNKSLPDNKHQTPYNQKIPGVILQAQMVSQLLSRVLDDRPLIVFWPPWLNFIWIAAWSFLGGILTWCLRSQFNLLVAVIISLASLYGACLYLLTQGFWIPLIPSVLTLFGTAAVVLSIINLKKSRSI